MAARLTRIELKPSDHKKCLGPRVKAALSQLLSCHSVEQARSACEAAAWGTTYSRNACIWLVEDEAVAAIAKFMRVCSTNKSNASLLCSMLTTLANILSHSAKVVPVDPTLLAGMMPTISDLLQLFRCSFRCSTEGVVDHCAEGMCWFDTAQWLRDTIMRLVDAVYVTVLCHGH